MAQCAVSLGKVSEITVVGSILVFMCVSLILGRFMPSFRSDFPQLSLTSTNATAPVTALFANYFHFGKCGAC